jgi:hypothetical protein
MPGTLGRAILAAAAFKRFTAPGAQSIEPETWLLRREGLYIEVDSGGKLWSIAVW